jgi:F-type H+-transporting ATPase subunit delta
VKNLIIAKRYAKALFNLAQEEGRIDEYGQELSEFIQLLSQLPDLADAIENPLYPGGAKRTVFESVADQLGMTPILKSFLTLLIEKDRMKHLGDIRDYYYRLIDEHANVARAQLKAAAPLDEGTINNISQALEGIIGKKIIVEFEQDPELIGGVTARIGDWVLDGSVRTQLYNIRESLKRGELG